MTVFKYKTFEDAEQALWNFNPDERFFRKIHELFFLAEKLNPVNYPPGVFKYKTFEEAQEQRLEWELQNAVDKES
jgi:hypothetical protein